MSSFHMASSQISARDSLSSALASAPPSELLYGGRRWRAIEHAPNRNKNSKRARAWSFGQEYEYVEDSKVRTWRCNHRTRDAVVVLFNKQINPANRHLQAKHSTIWDVDQEEVVEQDERVSGLIQRANITDFRFYLLR